jgi:hypothetical protein
MDGGALLNESQVTESSYFLINNGPTPRQNRPDFIPALNFDKVKEVQKLRLKQQFQQEKQQDESHIDQSEEDSDEEIEVSMGIRSTTRI